MGHDRRAEVVVAIVMALGTVGLALAAVAQPKYAVADVGDGHTRAYPKKLFVPPEGHDYPGRITRNLVTGKPQVVCSSDFPEATKDAIKRWNDRLGRDVLTFQPSEATCSELETVAAGDLTPSDGAIAVFVSVGTPISNGFRGRVSTGEKCPETARACVRQDGVSLALRTRYGRLEAILDPERYCRDAGAMPSTTCDADSQPASQDADQELRYVIAHELGHALSLGDYYCHHRNPDDSRSDTNQHPDFIDVPTLMNTFSLSPIEFRRTCNSPDGYPTTRDVTDYTTIYRPAAVTGLHAEVRRPELTLHWDQSDVFVENEFEIQQRNGMDGNWQYAAVAPRDATSLTLSVEVLETMPEMPVELRYRVVARTLALREEQASHGHAHSAPSEELVLTVLPPLATPEIEDVTGAVTDTQASLTLTWGEVVGARGYVVRRTFAQTCDEPSPSRHDAAKDSGTLTHTFLVDSRKTYLLCVRATPSIEGVASSDWAAVVASPPTPLTVTASIDGSASCRTGGTVNVRWNANGGRQPFTVSVDGEAIDTSTTSTNTTSIPCGN